MLLPDYHIQYQIGSDLWRRKHFIVIVTERESLREMMDLGWDIPSSSDFITWLVLTERMDLGGKGGTKFSDHF